MSGADFCTNLFFPRLGIHYFSIPRKRVPALILDIPHADLHDLEGETTGSDTFLLPNDEVMETKKRNLLLVAHIQADHFESHNKPCLGHVLRLKEQGSSNECVGWGPTNKRFSLRYDNDARSLLQL